MKCLTLQVLASSYFDVAQEESAVRAFLGWSPAALVLTSHFHSAGTEKMLLEADIPLIETWDYQPDRALVQIGFLVDIAGLAGLEQLVGVLGRQDGGGKRL